MYTLLLLTIVGQVPHYNLTIGKQEVSNFFDGSRAARTLGACTSTLAYCPQASSCTDTFGMYNCQDLLSNYDCPQLVGMGGCTACTCAPGTYDPNAAPPSPKTGSCTGQTSSPCYSHLAQWQEDSVLAKHNEYRAKHGACPLTYKKAIAAYTISSTGFTTTCSTKQLTHNNPPDNNGERYGENIAMVGGNKELHDYDPADGTQAWFCEEEGCWNYGTATNTGTTGHMTQVVWKDSTEIGCALCHVAASGGLTNVYLMCNYFSAGNFGYMGAGKEYAQNVLSPNTAATGCTSGPSMTDECAATPAPCGSDQSCNDADQTAPNNYVCTCTADSATTATGAQPTCVIDECAATPAPCGTGQTCNDPDTKASVSHDFTCTCDSDMTIVKIDGPATCTKDECTTTPCGTGQTCNDPNTSPSSTSDYTCTCTNGVVTTGGPATCLDDECGSGPCGTGQTCSDPNPAKSSVNDFTCTCDNDMTIVKTDGPAICVNDECSTTPCGMTQTCNDPQTSAAKTGDFVCTCPAPNMATTNVGGPAMCSMGSNDECMPNPCATGQSCVDPDQASAPANDFICSCTTGTGSATGMAATCTTDECDASPCGAGQTCNDPDTSVAVMNDFVCTCTAPKSGMMTGSAATCLLDECNAMPCGTGQTCNDPATATTSTGDFTCTCTNGVVATGTAATCEIDECAATPAPCGTGQTCNDPNPAKNSQHDFTCTCDNDMTIVQTDGPARCTKDECTVNPCSSGQTCNDPNTTFASKNDFTCTCTSTNAKAIGQAVPNCGADECTASPCGPGQGCKDSDTMKTGNFECSCPFGLEHNIGAPVAVCDECKVGNIGNPCDWAGHPEVVETCNDPNPSADSLNDFVCTCPNGVSKVGGPAECEKVGECTSSPCGQYQVCSDPDVNNAGDFVCTCSVGEGMTVGGPTTCVYDECKPRGNSLAPCPVLTQTCSDPDTAPSSTQDFVCTCIGDTYGSNEGSAADCKPRALVTPAPTYANGTEVPTECGGGVCGDQDCMDGTGLTVLNDYTCVCSDRRSAAGSQVVNCTMAAAPSSGSSGTALWIPIVAAVGGLALIAAIVLLVCARKKKGKMYMTEFFASNMNELGPEKVHESDAPNPSLEVAFV